MEHFTKRIMSEWRSTAKVFQSREGFLVIGYFNKHFIRNKRKRALQGNILEFFLLDTFETTFCAENLNQRWPPTGPFFSKTALLSIFKKNGRAGLPSPLVEHLWVGLNMHQYPWILLNILENAWINFSDYARALNMPNHHVPEAFKDSWGSKCANFWIRLHRVLNMTEYDWI